MIDEVIVVYAIVDDLLKAIGHQEDVRMQMSDAEIITSAIIAAMFFGGNQLLTCRYMREHKLMPRMLSKSRFNRRLDRLSMQMNDLFHQLGMVIKEVTGETEYLIDSFPVAICDNIRIFNLKLIESEEYRGYIASKKRYFYGVKVHLLTTRSGIPVEFAILPGEANDTRGLSSLSLNLPAGSEIYADAGYTDYLAEDDLAASEQISLKVMRKHNSKRKDAPWISYLKQKIRHYIETVFSSIIRQFSKSIHAVTYQGFILKIEMFIWSLTLQQAFL
jgi:IS5 family transposase